VANTVGKILNVTFFIFCLGSIGYSLQLQKDIDTSGQITAGVPAIKVNLRKDVTNGVIDTNVIP